MHGVYFRNHQGRYLHDSTCPLVRIPEHDRYYISPSTFCTTPKLPVPTPDSFPMTILALGVSSSSRSCSSTASLRKPTVVSKLIFMKPLVALLMPMRLKALYLPDRRHEVGDELQVPRVDGDGVPLEHGVDLADNRGSGGFDAVVLKHVGHAVGEDAVRVDHVLVVAHGDEVHALGDDECVSSLAFR